MHIDVDSLYEALGDCMKDFKRWVIILTLCAPCAIFLSDFSLAFAVEFRYDSHGKRDPFVSPANAGAQLGSGELRLEGVVVDKKGGSYAIVNSQIVKEGESLQGFLLKKVDSNRVLFEKEGEDFEIILRQDEELLKQYSGTQQENQQPVEGTAPPAKPSGQKFEEPVQR